MHDALSDAVKDPQPDKIALCKRNLHHALGRPHVTDSECAFLALIDEQLRQAIERNVLDQRIGVLLVEGAEILARVENDGCSPSPEQLDDWIRRMTAVTDTLVTRWLRRGDEELIRRWVRGSDK